MFEFVPCSSCKVQKSLYADCLSKIASRNYTLTSMKNKQGVFSSFGHIPLASAVPEEAGATERLEHSRKNLNYQEL